MEHEQRPSRRHHGGIAADVDQPPSSPAGGRRGHLSTGRCTGRACAWSRSTPLTTPRPCTPRRKARGPITSCGSTCPMARSRTPASFAHGWPTAPAANAAGDRGDLPGRGHAFDDLGNRRLEWKCDATNARSRRAAERFGFEFEGVFRQHTIVKGRNRDTAWYSLPARPGMADGAGRVPGVACCCELRRPRPPAPRVGGAAIGMRSERR